MKKIYALLLLITCCLLNVSAQSWTPQTSGTTQNLFSLSFPSSTVGWAVGASGTARATNNAGQTWSSQTAASLTWYSSSFLSTSQGWICGSGGGMMLTTNGTSWSPTVTNTTNDLFDMQMVSATTGWIVGAAGTIRRTTGSGWIAQSSGTNLNLRAVHFLNLNEGWVAGDTGKILKTTNSGTNWTSLTSGTTQNLYGMFFISNTQGWVVGAGGTIRTTTNGGTTWTAQTSGTSQLLRSVYFVSATQGWAVGDNGVILKTTNGGTTWTTEVSGTTQQLNSVYMVSATSGWIAGNNGTILVYCNPPAQPGTITGATNVCVGASQTYSVAAVAGATSYTWTLPSGWTGTSTTNSITATVGPAGSGTISVRANIGGCGSAVRTLSVTSNTVPSLSGFINANSSSVCSGSTQTFSVTAVAGATSYTWTLPAGWSGSSTTNSIIVTVGTSGGTVSVTANNGPCSSAPLTRPFSVITVPAQPGAISGLNPVCAGTSSTYAVTFVSGLTYNWTLPAGWSGSSTGNGIPATVGTTGGTISVSAVNTCGNSTPSTLAVTVNPIPAQPGVISGNDTACFNTSNTYSVTAVPNATSYTWTKPGGWTGTSTGNSITLTAGSVGGNITVKANNGSCSSPTQTLAVTVITAPLNAPGNITGATQVCSNSAQTYSVPGISSATSYNWTLPSGWTGSSSTTSINVTTSSTAGTVSVVAVNTCGSSLASTLPVTVSGTVTPTISISATQNPVCPGATMNFTSAITNGGNAPAYQWRKNGNNISGATSSTYSSSAFLSGDVISCVLTSNSGCANPTTATSNNITVAITPNVTPGVSISTPVTTICAGDGVIFIATPTNGGASPSYQWKVNGSNVGSNTATYTSSSLANNDVVTCVLTSNANCASPTTATSNSITLTVNPLVTPSVNISATQTTICSGNSVTFTASPTNGGNAPAYQWKLNGNNISGATNATYSSNSLANNDVITCVLTSNANCAASSTATSNAITITVSGSVTPSVAVTASADSICPGQSVTFTATPANGGSNPGYQWKKNGNNISGATSATYIASNLLSSDVFSCVLTSSVACASPTTATASGISVYVRPTAVPAVSISATGTTLCAGATVTFTATSSNGGSNPAYQWKKNGANINGASNASYTSTTLINGDIITCVLTSNALCASPSTATSNSITMTINPQVTPSVSISATQTTVCSGNSVTFTATPTNGGTLPSYQWKLNGNNVGTNVSTYTSTTLNNGDQISCALTSNANCATTSTATSNIITIIVSSSVTPSLVVTASSDSICPGESVTFSANPTNGGSTPGYQWKKNGNNISGATNATYATSTLLSTDVFSCVLTSSVGCASPTTATSNNKSVFVKSTFAPTVSVTPSVSIACEGDNINFSSAVTGEGNSPAYQWKVNGANISGAIGNAFSSATLVSGDIVTLELTSSDACAVPATVSSSPAALTINSLVTPSVSVSASQTVICSGASVTFTATVVNGGTNPTYQWKLNGNNISGETGSTYTSTSLVDGDVVSCDITSNASCLTAGSASSAGITLTENTNVVASVNIATSSISICNGQPITFTATPVNGGASPLYQWKKNNTDISGATLASYTDASPANNDVYKCEMTSNASCVQQPTVLSNEETVTVNTLPDVTITQAANVLSVSQAAGYQWFDCGTSADISGATAATYTATANGSYAVRVSNSAGCADTSACVNVTGVGTEDLHSLNMQVSPNPFRGFIIISLLDLVEEEATATLYDVTGRSVWTEKITSSVYQMDASQVAQGSYVLRVTSGERVWTKQLVKE